VSTPATQTAPFEMILETLNQRLAEFIALLAEEAEALTSNNPERLGEINQTRRDATEQISGLSGQLAEHLGLPANAGLPALRTRAFLDQPASPNWLQLEKLSQEAARRNQINGRLIEEQMRRTQAALQILQSASRRGLYGADGRFNNTFNTNRSIDTA
jgi:flagellar biosynthesis/type III secretory pathway chaperone